MHRTCVLVRAPGYAVQALPLAYFATICDCAAQGAHKPRWWLVAVAAVCNLLRKMNDVLMDYFHHLLKVDHQDACKLIGADGGMLTHGQIGVEISSDNHKQTKLNSLFSR